MNENMELIKFRNPSTRDEIEISIPSQADWKKISIEVKSKLYFKSSLDYLILVDDDGDEFGGQIKTAEKFWRFHAKRYSSTGRMAFEAHETATVASNLIQNSSVITEKQLSNGKLSNHSSPVEPSKKSSLLNKVISDEISPASKKILEKYTANKQSNRNIDLFAETILFHARLESESSQVIDVNVPKNCLWEDIIQSFSKAFQVPVQNIKKFIYVDSNGIQSNAIITGSGFWNKYKVSHGTGEILVVMDEVYVNSKMVSDYNKNNKNQSTNDNNHNHTNNNSTSIRSISKTTTSRSFLDDDYKIDNSTISPPALHPQTQSTKSSTAAVRVCQSTNHARKSEIYLPYQASWQLMTEAILAGLGITESNKIISKIILINSNEKQIDTVITNATIFWDVYYKSYLEHSLMVFAVFLSQNTPNKNNNDDLTTTSLLDFHYTSDSHPSNASTIKPSIEKNIVPQSVSTTSSSTSNDTTTTTTTSTSSNNHIDNISDLKRNEIEDIRKSIQQEREKAKQNRFESNILRDKNNNSLLHDLLPPPPPTTTIYNSFQFNKSKNYDTSTIAKDYNGNNVSSTVNPTSSTIVYSTNVTNKSPLSSALKQIRFCLTDNISKSYEIILPLECTWSVITERVLEELKVDIKHHKVEHLILYDSDGDVLSPPLNNESKFWKFCSKYNYDDNVMFHTVIVNITSDLEEVLNNTTTTQTTCTTSLPSNSSISDSISNKSSSLANDETSKTVLELPTEVIPISSPINDSMSPNISPNNSSGDHCQTDSMTTSIYSISQENSSKSTTNSNNNKEITEKIMSNNSYGNQTAENKGIHQHANSDELQNNNNNNNNNNNHTHNNITNEKQANQESIPNYESKILTNNSHILSKKKKTQIKDNNETDSNYIHSISNISDITNTTYNNNNNNNNNNNLPTDSPTRLEYQEHISAKKASNYFHHMKNFTTSSNSNNSSSNNGNNSSNSSSYVKESENRIQQTPPLDSNSKSNVDKNSSKIKFQFSNTPTTSTNYSLIIPTNSDWEILVNTIANFIPLLKPEWIHSFILLDEDGDELSPELSNASKFWKIHSKYPNHAEVSYQINFDEENFYQEVEYQQKIETEEKSQQKQKNSSDIIIKVRLHSDKKRFSFANISLQNNWEEIKHEISMSLGLITSARIKYLILIDSDEDDISPHLTNATKFLSLCSTVYEENKGMTFDVFLYETPKTNGTLDILFSYNSIPSSSSNMDNANISYDSNDSVKKFFESCISGSLSTCRQLLLQDSIDVMSKDSNGMYVIHATALAGHIEIVKWLLSLKVPIDLCDDNYMTPLHYACDGMHSNLVLFLVGVEANLQAKNKFGLTPLHYICLRGLIELVHLFKPTNINNTSSTGLTCLHCASDGGHEEMVSYLLSHGADIDCRDADGFAPLHFASLSGHWTVCQVLVEHGAFWNVRDDDAMTPLLNACSEGHLEIVQWLVAIGSNLFARNDLGNNALHLACASGSIELVNWLLMKGIDLNSRNKDGLAPYHIASESGHIELASFLGAVGASLWMETEEEESIRIAADERNELFLRACEEEEMKIHSLSLAMKKKEKEKENKGKEKKPKKEIFEPPIDDDQFHKDILEYENDSTTSSTHSSNNHVEENTVGQQLQNACSTGNLELVTKLLRKGVSPNTKNANGSSPLHFASAVGNLAIAKKLVEAGANVNSINSKSSSPLHFACDRNHPDVILYLVEKNADFSIKNDDGYTPLHYLSTRGPAELMQTVAEKRDDFDPNCCGSKNVTLLHCAAEQGLEEMILILIKLGAMTDAVDDDNETPLHYACLRGHLIVAKLLIEKKAKVNARDNEGSTPLFYACSSGNLALVKLLVSHGALPYNINRRGNNCLHIACKMGNTEIAMWLLDYGVDINAKNHVGVTPYDFALSGSHTDLIKALDAKKVEVKEVEEVQEETVATFHQAASQGDIVLVNRILKDGFDPNTRNENHSTAFHFAAVGGQLEVMKLLHSVRADFNAKNNSGLTPFLCACIRGHVEIAMWLSEQGADMDCRTPDGRTALHHASLNGHLNTVIWLVKHGVDLTTTNICATTPLSDACFGGHLDVVKHLVSIGGVSVKLKAMKSSPIHIACEEGHLDVVKWLISQGAAADAVDENGKTPFLYACFEGYLDIAQYLSKLGVNIRATGGASDRLNTALHLACQNGHIDIVKWLVECGLDINAKNGKGRTPLEFAQVGGYVELVDWLIAQGSHYCEETVRKRKQPKLEDAIESNDFELAQKLLEDLMLSIGPFSECPKKCTPLHFAAACGHVELAQHLIICGVNINAITVLGQTPLHFASMRGQLEMVEYLVELGAVINYRDLHGNTALNLASVNKHIETYQWLKEHGGITGDQLKEHINSTNTNKSILSSSFSCVSSTIITPSTTTASELCKSNSPKDANKRNSFQSVESSSSTFTSSGNSSSLFSCISGTESRKFDTLASLGSNFDDRYTMSNEENESFNFNLHDACNAGDFVKVRNIIESQRKGQGQGGDKGNNGINEPNPVGASTPLHLACVSGSIELIEYLIDHGARLDLKNVGGMTPLHIACDRRHTELALLLIKKGADVLARNKIGDTPLHKLCARGMSELLELVIDLPRTLLPVLDLEVKTDRGFTPLHAAADQCCFDVCKLLIEQSVQVNPRDEENRSPLHYGCAKGYKAVVELLCDHGAYINARDNLGVTPVLLACTGEHTDLVKWLSQRGANMKVITDSGDSCLHVACKLGNRQLVTWLIEVRKLDPFLQNNQNLSPYQLVVDRGYTDIIQFINNYKKNKGKKEEF